MKKLLVVIALIGSGLYAHSQESVNVKSTEIHQGFKSGHFVMSVPESITEEQLNKVKTHYTNYFEVKLDETKDQLVFDMLKKDDQMAFRVVNRLLVSLNLKTILVDGNPMTFEEMAKRYYN